MEHVFLLTRWEHIRSVVHDQTANCHVFRCFSVQKIHECVSVLVLLNITLKPPVPLHIWILKYLHKNDQSMHSLYVQTKYCYPCQVCNSVEDCPDASLTALAGSTDEQSCRAWSSWGPWGPCSTSCGTGSMSRERSCPHGDPLRHCRGQKIQHQPCFRTTCPGKEISAKYNTTSSKYVLNLDTALYHRYERAEYLISSLTFVSFLKCSRIYPPKAMFTPGMWHAFNNVQNMFLECTFSAWWLN